MSYLLSRTLVPTMVHYLLAARPRRTRTGTRAQRGSSRAASRLQPRLRAAARDATAAGSRWALAHRAVVVGGVRRCSSARSVGAACRSSGATSSRRVDAGLDQAARARRAGHAHRGDREALRARSSDTIRTVIPPSEIETMLDNIGTPYSGINLSLSEGALISPADGADPDRAQGGPRADGRLRARAARARSREHYPDDDVLLPRARHLDAGAELRARRADRRAGRRADRQRGRRRSTSRRQIAARDRADPRRRRRAPRAGAARARSSRSTSIARMAQQAGPHRARRRERPARLAVVERAGRAELLARQARRAVPRRGADAAVRDRLDRGARARRRSRPATARAAAARRNVAHDLAHDRRRRTSRTTTSRARSTCRPTSTAPISARSPTRVEQRSSTSCEPDAAARHARSRIKGQVESMESLVPRPRLRPRLRGRCSSTC